MMWAVVLLLSVFCLGIEGQPTFCGCYCDSSQTSLCSGTYDAIQTAGECQVTCGLRSSFLGGSAWTFPINASFTVASGCNSTVSCCPSGTFSTGVQGSSFTLQLTGQCGGSSSATVIINAALSSVALEPTGSAVLGGTAANNVSVTFPSVDFAVFGTGGASQVNADRVEPSCCSVTSYELSTYYSGRNFTGTIVAQQIERKTCSPSTVSGSSDTLYGSLLVQCISSPATVDVSAFPNRQLWYSHTDNTCSNQYSEAYYWQNNFCLVYLEGRIVKSVGRRCSGGNLYEDVYVNSNCQGTLLRSTPVPTGQCLGDLPEGFYTLVCANASSASLSLLLLLVVLLLSL